MKARPVRRADGNVAHLLGTIVDISDIREMKLEIERQRQSLAHLTRVSMVGKLSNTLAHELNQPLTAIMSNAQAAQRLITKIPLDIDELKSAIEDIIQDDTRAGEVIRHIRGLLKNKADFFEELDLNAVVASALEFMLSDAQPDAAPVSVLLDTGDQPIAVEAGGGAIRARLGAADRADLTLRGAPRPIMGLLLGRLELDAAVAAGVSYEGDPAVLDRFGAETALA